MMKKNVSKSTRKFAVLLLIPAFAVFLSAFAKPEYSYSVSAPTGQDKIVTVDSVVVVGAGSMGILNKGQKDVPIFTLGKGKPSDVTYYVDGKEISSVEDLNPEDIHSISILKDKTAMELYAKEGVIMINTKKYVQETGIENENKGAAPTGKAKDKSGTRFTLRGVELLTIVDDKEYSGDVQTFVDANEIESVIIWKDTSAIARYGEKGKDGVIIITTKAAAEAEKHNP